MKFRLLLILSLVCVLLLPACRHHHNDGKSGKSQPSKGQSYDSKSGSQQGPQQGHKKGAALSTSSMYVLQSPSALVAVSSEESLMVAAQAPAPQKQQVQQKVQEKKPEPKPQPKPQPQPSPKTPTKAPEHIKGHKG